MKIIRDIFIAGILVFIIMIIGFQTGCTVDQDNLNNDTNNVAIDSNTVIIQNSIFTPSSLTVKQGTRVIWQNQDGMDHTVTSNNGLFDSGNIRNKGSFSYKFTDMGTYQYHCRLHPQMQGSIIVQ
jgi:plastocyanin